MNYTKTLGAGLLVAALAVMGCGPQGSTRTDDRKDQAAKKDDHAHGKGPHGGVVFDFGKYHAELTIEHPKKEMTVFILGSDEKTPKAVAAKELTVVTKQAKTKAGKIVESMTIALKAKDEKDGKATTFVGTDPGLGVEADHEGTLFGEVDGKRTEGKFKEE
jgi:hypothetical protein